MSEPAHSEPTLDGLAARLCADQCRRWRQGERVPVEAYLAQHPVLDSEPEALLDLIYNEVVLREEQGETPRLDEYLQRFPRFAAQLRIQFQIHEAIQAGPSADAGSDDLLTFSAKARMPAALADSPGIPGYEILGELGRGGMGVVYKARQVRANRMVALKMIRAGAHAGAQDLARFRTEAEAVARLQHPHIVQIHEVGEHQGCPFFSLEFVNGSSLDQKLAHKPVPAKEAAQLMETLARAIHYAHQRGIIHRDLKPSNVLLTTDGQPKIADFGLAKKLDEARGQTQTGQVVGTPSYMAPEQAAGQSKLVGPAVDVYALGVLLYELLTGRPPFEAETAAETLVQVCNQEPAPPSRVQPAIPRDLETICLKCLQKQPAIRYATAEALADDLRRFLAGQPILARPVGRVERLWRWGHRRPAVAGLLLALGLVLLTGIAGVIWQGQRVRQHESRTREEETKGERERLRAEANARKVRVLLPQLTQLAGELANRPQMELQQRAIWEKALVLYQELLNEGSTDPAVRREMAGVCIHVGFIRRVLGSRSEAEDPFRTAILLMEELAEESPSRADYRDELARAHRELGTLLRILGKPSQAAESFGRAMKLWEHLVADFPKNTAYRSNLANLLCNYSLASSGQGRVAEAEEFVRRGIALHEEALTARPGDVQCHHELSLGLDTLARLLVAEGKQQEAESLFCRAVALAWGVVKAGRANAWDRFHLAHMLYHLGFLVRGPDRLEETEAAYREAISLLDKSAVEYPGVFELRENLADYLEALSHLVEGNHRVAEAQAIHRRALAHREKLAADYPKVPVYRESVSRAHFRLARLLLQSGRYGEAAAIYREAMRGGLHFASAANNLAWLLATSPDEEDRDPAEAVRLAKQAVAAVPTNGQFLNTLGVAYYRSGDLKSALTELDKSMGVRFGGDSQDWYFLAMVHWRLGDTGQARKWYAQAVAWQVKNKPQDDELRRFRAEAEAMMNEGRN